MGFLTKVLSKVGSAIAKPLGWASGIASSVSPWAGAAYSLWGDRKSRKQEKAYRERNSLTGRVAEAKAAGIHPLAALGYNAGGDYGGQSASGSPISDAVRGISRKRLTQAQIHATEASAGRDIAEAALLNSQAKRIQQAANSQPTAPTGAILTGPGQGKFQTSKSTPQQVVEDEYGGVVGEGYGIYRFLQDYFGPNRPGRTYPDKKQYKNWTEGYAPKHGRRTYNFNRR